MSQKDVEALNSFFSPYRTGENFFFKKEKILRLDIPHPELKVGWERAHCAFVITESSARGRSFQRMASSVVTP